MTEQMSLDDLSDAIWATLKRASADRNAPMRWPTLASVDDQGHAQLRTIVLRSVDSFARTLTAYTDARSEKITQLAKTPRVQLHFFDPRKMLQIRLDADTIIHSEGPFWNTRWCALTDRAKGDYATITAPGKSGAAGKDLVQAEENFRVLEFSALRADWLSLGRDGHARAKINWEDGRTIGDWVTP